MLEGNWKGMPVGKIFKVEDCNYFVLDPLEPDCVLVTVDTAHELKTSNDYTVIQVWARYEQKIYLIHQVRGKFDYGTQEQMVISICYQHSPNYVGIEKKGNGHALLQEIPKKCAIPLIAIERSKDKYTRGFQTEPYVSSGYVYLNQASDYYADFISEISNFSPEAPSQRNGQKLHDDQVDAMMDAIDLLLIKKIKGSAKETAKYEHINVNSHKKAPLSSFSEQIYNQRPVNYTKRSRLFE